MNLSLLKPDLKAIVWLGIGYFVVGRAINMVAGKK